MYELLYTSFAVRFMSSQDLEEILRVARARNSRLKVTGILLYQRREFMQLLEGEEDAVREVFSSIQADTRHHSVRVVYEAPVARRSFPDWSMAYPDLAAIDPQKLGSQARFLEEGFSGLNAQNYSNAQELLLSLRSCLKTA